MLCKGEIMVMCSIILSSGVVYVDKILATSQECMAGQW